MSEDTSKVKWQRAREDGVLKVEGKVDGAEEVECKFFVDGEG